MINLLNGQIMLMMDLILNIDSLHLKDDESVDDVIEYLKERWDFGYEPQYELLYEEKVGEDNMDCICKCVCENGERIKELEEENKKLKSEKHDLEVVCASYLALLLGKMG